jgi:hypothetical protein
MRNLCEQSSQTGAKARIIEYVRLRLHHSLDQFCFPVTLVFEWRSRLFQPFLRCAKMFVPELYEVVEAHRKSQADRGPGEKEDVVMAETSQKNPELSSRLLKTNEELKNLQSSVRTGMINVKVLMEFRTATERARQASAAVQQWLDAQGKGGDPYKLMEQVMSQRVEMTTQLVKDVTVDLESLDVDYDTPGLPALNEAVRKLVERLEKLFPR